MGVFGSWYTQEKEDYRHLEEAERIKKEKFKGRPVRPLDDDDYSSSDTGESSYEDSESEYYDDSEEEVEADEEGETKQITKENSKTVQSADLAKEKENVNKRYSQDSNASVMTNGRRRSSWAREL